MYCYQRKCQHLKNNIAISLPLPSNYPPQNVNKKNEKPNNPYKSFITCGLK